MKDKKHVGKLEVLGKFVGHLAMGVAMFAALLFFGSGLTMLVHWAAPFVGDASFIADMMLVEKFIHYADMLLIVWWSIFSTYEAIK
jgi:ABC-type uncharacterized transport system permease subunit